MNLEKIFTDFVKKNNLLNKNIILMVSGGVDSISLLEVATKILKQNQINVLHVNHKTRKNCVREQEFVSEFCYQKGVSFFSKSLGKVPQKNQENFWRDERKKFAESVKKKTKSSTILTAHHATDLVETMIFRLTKGCGLSGLSPFDEKTKPFWEIPKSEILKYARDKKLTWCEDESNQSLDHERNLIRNKVLPELRKITPNLETVFVRETKLFAEMQDFITQEIKKTMPRGKTIPLKVFLTLHPILQKEFLRNVSSKTPSASEIDDCLRWIGKNPKGNSKKEIGGTHLQILSGKIVW